MSILIHWFFVASALTFVKNKTRCPDLPCSYEGAYSIVEMNERSLEVCWGCPFLWGMDAIKTLPVWSHWPYSPITTSQHSVKIKTHIQASLVKFFVSPLWLQVLIDKGQQEEHKIKWTGKGEKKQQMRR